jgi:putative redox protein
MICSKSEEPRYLTRFSNGAHEGIADTTADKGGGSCGFRPHDLLEAALATCVNMAVRIYADRHDIPLRSVRTKVTLDRSQADEVVFRYELELDGELTPEHKDKLLHAANLCPVRRTLAKKIRFESGLDSNEASC